MAHGMLEFKTLEQLVTPDLSCTQRVQPRNRYLILCKHKIFATHRLKSVLRPVETGDTVTRCLRWSSSGQDKIIYGNEFAGRLDFSQQARGKILRNVLLEVQNASKQ